MLVTLNKGYKFKIKPTQEQKEFFMKSFGCSRKIYNLYVDELYKYLEKINYQNGSIKDFKIKSPANIKKNFEFMKEVDSLALCNAQIDFKNALNKFNKEYDKKSYTKRSKKREKSLGVKPTFKDLEGMPKFKSIKKNDFSYKTNNQVNKRTGEWNNIKLENKQLKIPKLKTTIKVIQHRDLPPNSIIKNCTISMDNLGIFYCSLCIEYTKEIEHKPSEKVLGLDYSSHDFYYSSDNKIANYPHYYRKSEEKLKLLQRQLSRKQSKSNNWEKHKNKIIKLQKHIANQRLDWLHKESRKLCNNYDAIIFEDIDLRSMGQCLKLGKSTHDNGFGMFRQFCKYKLEEQGKQFIKIDKWYPSSKTCSCCGHIKEDLQLSDRVYICKECGNVIDRDYNASINIRDEGLRLLLSNCI